MAKPKPHYIDVDLKKKTQYNVPFVTQNDSDTVLILRITDDGQSDPSILDAFTTITLTSERRDRKSFYVLGERIAGTNEIQFRLGTTELELVGSVTAAVQFYSEEGRQSSAHFRYDVEKDVTSEYVPAGREATLIETVLIEGPRIMEEAEQATADAIQAMQDLTGAVNGALETLQQDKAAALETMAAATGKANTAAGNADRERVRLTLEATQKIEDVEAERLATENVRIATQGVQEATETVRQNTETERAATEQVRTDTQAVQEATETVRVETADARDGANAAAKYATEQGNFAKQQGETQQLQMSDVAETMDYISSDFLPSTAQALAGMDQVVQDSHTKAADAQMKATDAKQVAETVRTEFDQVVAEAGSSNPEVVNARGSHATLKQRLDTADQRVIETDRQTQLLQNGTNVLSADVATPVEFEVQGRTLTSLANSNLEGGKYYAVADKKTKVAVDNTVVSGIGKFQKKSTTLTIADFMGKVSGSNTANPHISKHNSYGTEATLLSPANFTNESSANGYSSVNTLNGTSGIVIATRASVSAQHLFTFNVVEQIERQLGLIPKMTLAEKIQWVKDNVNRLTSNWHGFGSSTGGNKATFSIWSSLSNAWALPISHTLTTPYKITQAHGGADVPNRIDTNGFAHFLAYAEPSDGTTASTINTDYINLEIELKGTAQLNTRGRIIRVENFEGKVSGSTVENPHVARVAGAAGLQTPINFGGEFNDARYDLIENLNGSGFQSGGLGVNVIAQQLFSFNLIEAVERNIGKIPAANVTGKVEWVRNNINRLIIGWFGFGSSPTGNKGMFGVANKGGTYDSLGGHSGSSPTKVSYILGQTGGVIPYYTQNDGFIHFLAHAEPSDGVTASTINTDYIELEIELKDYADFRNPKVPLYEVAKEDFDKIGTTWTEDDTLKRFPIVEGPQHLVNPYLMSEGENLWQEGKVTYGNSAMNGWGSLTATFDFINQSMSFMKDAYESIANELQLLPNQKYTLSFKNSTTNSFRVDINGVIIYANNKAAEAIHTFTTNATGITKIAFATGNVSAPVPYSLTDITLNLGTTVKPFTPRNPSYLFAETKLGAIGTAKDTLFRQDGQWKRRKVIEKDVVLDGSIAWASYGAYNKPGYQGATGPAIKESVYYHKDVRVSDYKGELLRNQSIPLWSNGDEYTLGVNNSNLYISVKNEKTGFTDGVFTTYLDWKRYFNGWKYTDGVTYTSVTGNGQTATAQQALDTKPTDYTPYKLSYVLATPVIENVTVEGEIIADGLTQIEAGSGLIVREKFVPKEIGTTGTFYLNHIIINNPLKNKAQKFLGVYKNGEIDPTWTPYVHVNFFGGIGMQTKTFDPTAEYTVTYQALDKPKLTVNPVDIKAVFAKNIRSAVDDIANRMGDGLTRLSIVERAVVDFYVKLKALGAK